jgi:hypothetical protein
MNSLRTGGRSAVHKNFVLLLLNAPPCSVDRVARAFLTPEQAAHPFFREIVDMSRRAESEAAAMSVWQPAGVAPQRRTPPKNRERSLNLLENNTPLI